MSSLEIRRIHIEAWQTSGMSQAAYCRKHGLNAKTFGNWLRIYRSGREVVRSSALVPVTIKPMSMTANTLRLRGQGDHVLELPSTVSPHWLGELLKCL
ncbi:IS66 family insertion sequence element accessory protein TnpB [Nitrosomonas communis]|uniref:IS66 family insertion sequence element accessory protein TnpA n=1 Tax=Nitrosomonas communis TaxID=44574 RepID=UPI0026E95C8D|nr:IS66 family insertion sequence element accessory protein TnpB [Nitrosomonas communis]MCO6427092.1 IS66 family insertion sequence element accessory protein TnpB [Nitrosomonas communis]